MRKIVLTLLVACAAICNAHSQTDYTPSPENLRAREEFAAMRFGVFIHWGIYSMLGDGEWVMHNRNIDCAEYARLAGGFCPSQFSATEWVSAVKASGARYITFTSRHHDGFAMFASAASDYNVVRATPFARDVVGELADECRRQGIKLHLYYSHLDWGRTDYYPLGRTGQGTGRTEQGEWRNYQSFMKAQLVELLTSYGDIGAIWFDGVWDKDSEPVEAQPAIWGLYDQYKLIHTLQPACLVGNNHHQKCFAGEDIQIFERDIPGENTYGYSGQEIARLSLETCQTMNRSWGYRITDRDYKSADELIVYLVRTAAKGANLLLNIGPRPDGTMPDEAIERLQAIGEWLNVCGEAVYDTEGGSLGEQPWGVMTQKGSTLYLHILEPATEIVLPFTVKSNKLRSASYLRSGEKIKCRQTKSGLVVPVSQSLTEVDTIIKLDFAKEL